MSSRSDLVGPLRPRHSVFISAPTASASDAGHPRTGNRKTQITRAGLAWVLLLVGCLPVVADAPTPEAIAFFESKVRPILVTHCYECHSVQGDSMEAGLLLDSKWGWQTGGESGPAIVPGDLEQSLLIEAVRYQEETVSGMPPRSKLPEDQIQILERWVEMGAPDPRPKVEAKAGASDAEPFDLQQRVQEHWSWKPIQAATPPAVRNESWPSGPIDRFILSKLEQSGLEPAPPASKRQWLRRVHFDLIGLPPTVQQINAFLADESADAHERVVDQLLESQHFGEKWARHWLDLVRYAETYGHEFDYPITGATEYRDYVIRALNADLPFDQFAREQIAGDLLDQPRRHPQQGFNESILGTGFWYLHEATHAPTDVLGDEAAIIDNQLDVFGKAFLGLTIACARCHDHKFDAISTADYYALSAYLQSSCRQQVNLDPQGRREALNQQIREAVEKAATQLATAASDPQPFSASLSDMLSPLALPVDHEAATPPRSVAATSDFIPFADFDSSAEFEKGQFPNGWSSTDEAFQAIGSKLVLRTDGTVAMPGTIDSGVAGGKQVGTLRSPTFEISTSMIHIRMKATANVTVQVVIDNYRMATFSDLLFRGTLLHGANTDTGGTWAWKSLGGDLKKYLGHRAYLEFVDSGDGSIAVDQVVFSNQPVPVEPESVPLNPSEFQSRVAQSLQDIAHQRSNRWLAWQTDRQAISVDKLDPQAGAFLATARQCAEQLPAPHFVLAMAQGTEENARVYIRGNHANLGESVPPRFLTALGGKPGSRLDLANQVASPDNPLTARVTVNRVWHHLFGRGLVPTVDDFGPQGQPPSHPELLDWLAQDLIDSGWSLKHAIRAMVLSQTYRQDSVASPNLDADWIARTDPTNRLLHRMPVRRLPAESIRDAILAVSGRLDPTPFGPSVPTHRTPFMTGRGARPSGPLDGNGRRSIYLAVYRNFLNPFLSTFDTPGPFGPQGRRSQSNVPAQALALMNDPMVIQQAQTWARRVADDSQTSMEQRIAQMVETAHGTEASAAQQAMLSEFLTEQATVYGALDERAWTDLAHALFNMKAFYFVR